MTGRQFYDLATHGGGNDFQAVVELLERLSIPWCLISGVAVNVYCDPLLTSDADFVVVASQLDFVCAELNGLGFAISTHRFSVNAHLPGSQLLIQFTIDPRYQDFLGRATLAEALGIQCRVAALRDLFQGKLWASADPERRPVKRFKDELDLVRIAEKYAEYLELLLPALRARFS
jgi:hypothetical protein